MRVSFDFDGTLDIDNIEAYAKELIARGVTVIITTSRPDNISANDMYKTEDYNADLTRTAKRLGITEIYHTTYQDKVHTLNELDVLWHLDDEASELKAIKMYGLGVVGITYKSNPEWKEETERLIENDYGIS